jgi:hypothetical protein
MQCLHPPTVCVDTNGIPDSVIANPLDVVLMTSKGALPLKVATSPVVLTPILLQPLRLVNEK